MSITKNIKARGLFFAMSTIAATAMAIMPLHDLLSDPQISAYYMHIPLIPVISAFFLVLRRDHVFASRGTGGWGSLALIATGIGLYYLGITIPIGSGGLATALVSAALMVWAGLFWLLFGTEALKRALFPVAFLVLLVPIPRELMQVIFSFLVSGTAAVAHLFLRAMHIPALREGHMLILPNLDLEVIPACSGFRSSLALLITSLVAGQLFLKRIWSKTALVCFVIPLAVLKSGARIAALYLLYYFMDVRVIEPSNAFHRSTAYVFFLAALAILAVILGFFKVLETPRRKGGRLDQL